MENGNIDDFPEEVFAFFNKKGSGKTTVTPALLQRMIGSTTIPLAKYDIYVMGKKKGSSKPFFYTKIRIDTKASERNTVQGLLEVRLIAGYGYRKTGCDSSTQILRPAGIQKLVTDDTSSFKKRAVIYLGGDVVALKDADGFCDIPLMDDRKLAKFEKGTNAKKREAYARKKKFDNQWAHINRVTMSAMNQKIIHRMLLPYKNNLPTDLYFQEFARDIWAGLLQLRQEFCPGEILELFPDLNKKKRKLEEEPVQKPQTKKRRVLDKISKNANTLRRIPSSDISW